MTSPNSEIHVVPSHIVPGGGITIQGEGFETKRAHTIRVFCGEKQVEVNGVTETKIAATIPEDAVAGNNEIRVEFEGGLSSSSPVCIAKEIAGKLQPVANPVFDNEKKLYVTLSGSRGTKVPVSIYCISDYGKAEPYNADILNPTGLAWGSDNCLYVSSRAEGTVYRINSDREIELFADGLGIATDIAFDPEGILHVGDRRGNILRVERNGEVRSFCRLEPSVSAYHLVFDREGNLFVSVPSLASRDQIFRIDAGAKVELFYQGFGRPQGMAFDEEGLLYVAEGLPGYSGVYVIDGSGVGLECRIASPPVVGVVFDNEGALVVATKSTLYSMGRPIDAYFHTECGVFSF